MENMPSSRCDRSDHPNVSMRERAKDFKVFHPARLFKNTDGGAVHPLRKPESIGTNVDRLAISQSTVRFFGGHSYGYLAQH